MDGQMGDRMNYSARQAVREYGSEWIWYCSSLKERKMKHFYDISKSQPEAGSG